MPNRAWERSLSDGSEVEASGFVGGPFGCAGAGVADEHVGAAPPSEGHQAGLGAAGGEPAVGRGVPESMRPEAVDPGALGATA